MNVGSRKQLIAGSQKLYLSLDNATSLARCLVSNLELRKLPFDLAICPSLINLASVAATLRGSQLQLGAQNVHQEDTGAFTGQVSIRELENLHVKYVILGHSELRSQQHETNEMVNRKVRICLMHQIVPIACVGETLDEYRAGESKQVIERDLYRMFEDIELKNFAEAVVAYEPSWAIKAGRDDRLTTAASSEQAAEIHGFIREVIASLYGKTVSQMMRIIYGGSVSSDNAAGFLRQREIDGLLIGTKSTELDSFLEIISMAEKGVAEQTRTGAVAS
jgi:triosephosphate isomerase